MVGRARPRVVGGVFGTLLVAALYMAHALLLRANGDGLGPGWLSALMLPGALAAHLSWRRGAPWALRARASREGALAGLLTAHFAAPLMLVTLIIGVLTTDWARYAQQVGPQIAEEVRSAAIPSTLVAGAVAVALAYGGCAAAGWLGATIYALARGIVNGSNAPPNHTG